ncbi:MAG: EAL domain-containing protein [Pseudomonadota bacterium]
MSGSAEEFAEIINLAPLAFWSADAGLRRIHFISRAAHALTGFDAGEFEGNPDLWFSRLLDADRQAALLIHEQVVRDRSPGRYQARFRHRDGSVRWLDNYVFPALDDAGKVVRQHGCVVDVTQAKQQEEALRKTALVFEHLYEGILITDAQGLIEHVNPAFTRITGYTAAEILGATPGILSSGLHDKAFYELMWSALLREGHWSGEIWNRRKSGEVYPQWLQIATIRDDAGAVQNYVAVFSDLSRRKALEAQVLHQAMHDVLTDLPNRRSLEERLLQAIAQARRHGNQLAVLFLDLDGFKEVNDTLGHEVGDVLLQLAARRLRSCLREEDTLARWGGDEFVVLLPRVDGLESVLTVAERLLAVLNVPFELDHMQLQLNGSIGIAQFPGCGQDVSTLLRHADAAMYAAKKEGGGKYRLFGRSVAPLMLERSLLKRGLQRALDGSEFVLHYQPKVDFHSGRIVGAEALLRWQDPERGLRGPVEFIALAEEMGLILPIGEWVLGEACRQAQRWHRAGHELHVAVNLSARQFQDPDLVAKLAQILAESRIAPCQLQLEVTESVAMERPEVGYAMMQECVAMGVGIAIDDFGTGYSSLAYLKRLPAREIKIDRAFVRDVVSDPDDRAIVGAVVALGRALGRRVTAEGVETREQFACLKEMGCDLVQGYWTGRPMPADAFEALLGTDRLFV